MKTAVWDRPSLFVACPASSKRRSPTGSKKQGASEVLHPFEFFAARDDSAVTLAPEGRQIVAQCVSTGNGVKDRRAPERGGRTGDECFFRPLPGLANLLYGPRARALGYSLSPSGLREHLFGCGLPLCGAANPGRSRLQAAICRRRGGPSLR